MFKGKLGIVPEVAAYTIGALIGIYALRALWDTEYAAKLATVPIVGTLLVTGPKALTEKALAG